MLYCNIGTYPISPFKRSFFLTFLRIRIMSNYSQLNTVHFSVAPFFKNILLCCYLEQIYIRFGANLTSKLNKFIQKLHLLMVLFGKNLMSNSSTLFLYFFTLIVKEKLLECQLKGSPCRSWLKGSKLWVKKWPTSINPFEFLF